MSNTILQVPINKNLRDRAVSSAQKMGFSSLQEVIRLFLNKMAEGEVSVKFEETEEITHLSPAAERKFKKAVEDIKAGRNIYKPKNKEEFFELLNS